MLADQLLRLRECDMLSSNFNLGVCVRLDRIWVTFMNVVSCSSVLSSINNFDNVRAMISCMCYIGREPHCPVIVDFRNSSSCIQWRFLGACGD